MNVNHPLFMLKKLLPQLQERSRRSAIIIVSAAMSYYVVPGYLTYASSKAMLSNFGMGIAKEVNDPKLDFQVFNCGSVKTKRNPRGLDSTEDAVHGSLRDLGIDLVTNGPYANDYKFEFAVKGANGYS